MAASSPAPPASSRRRRWRLGALVVVVLAVGIVTALATVPVPHRFSDVFSATREFGTVVLVAPQGSPISLNWSVSGGPASVSVSNGHGQLLDASAASSGSFQFTSTTPEDGFEANSTSSATVYLSWGYSSPVL